MILAVTLLSLWSQPNFARAENIENTIPLLCEGLDKSFKKRKWGENPCLDVKWETEYKSVQGRPLLYFDFGNKDSKNVTLFFAMVHGDEITPLYLGFQLIAWAKENMKRFPNARLIVAPLLNPDGFFGYPKTRTNAHGVDCNRNFKTKDWDKEALAAWKKKFHSEKRRFPGYQPDSEPETLFQEALIERFKPNKIISAHSPLNILDYDGPDKLRLKEFNEDYVKKCQELREKVKAKSTGFFPGSLGNYSGQERGIPTITLELKTANYEKAKEYWKQFKGGLETVINHDIPPKEKESEKEKEKNK